MIKHFFGLLLIGLLGYLCGISADHHEGWVQLLAIVAISAVGGATVGMIATGYRHIVKLYGVVFILSLFAYVVMNRLHGGA